MLFLYSAVTLCLLGVPTLCICLLSLVFIPSVDTLAERVSYDTSPTFVAFSLSNRNSQTDYTISTLRDLSNYYLTLKTTSVDSIYAEPKAFGYLSSAPNRSIILHTGSHWALYPAHILRFTISYPTDGLDPVVTSPVPDYMVCVETLDIRAGIILRCESSETITVLTFSDVIISVILNVMCSPNTQQIIKSFLDMSLRAIILCVDVSDKPSVVIRTLRLTLERNLRLKHDFFPLLILLYTSKLAVMQPTIVTICSMLKFEVRYLFATFMRKSGPEKLKFTAFKTKHTRQKSAFLNTNNCDSQLVSQIGLPVINELQMHIGGGKSNMPFMGSELAIMEVTGISQLLWICMADTNLLITWLLFMQKLEVQRVNISLVIVILLI